MADYDFRRGDVWLANLEQGKSRPVLIIQNDVPNQYSPVVIVAALTTAVSPKEFPTEVRVGAPEGGLKQESVVLLNQIRTIDKQRLSAHWGQLNVETLQKVDEALKVSLGLVKL